MQTSYEYVFGHLRFAMPMKISFDRDATELSAWFDPVNGQLSQELRFAKSVVRGMIEKGAIDPSIQSRAGYFFKKEKPRRA